MDQPNTLVQIRHALHHKSTVCRISFVSLNAVCHRFGRSMYQIEFVYSHCRDASLPWRHGQIQQVAWEIEAAIRGCLADVKRRRAMSIRRASLARLIEASENRRCASTVIAALSMGKTAIVGPRVPRLSV